MRRIVSSTLAVALMVMSLPALAAAAPQAGGTINGTAQNSAGETLGNYTVQLRNVATGQLAGTTTSNAAGSFSFAGLNAGNYVVEIVNAAGAIVGTSSPIAVAAGATVALTVTAAAAAAAMGAGGISTALLITTLAIGGGVAGVITALNKDDASGSK
jgi:hypothetical protein